jgi:hypothetical protein
MQWQYECMADPRCIAKMALNKRKTAHELAAVNEKVAQQRAVIG